MEISFTVRDYRVGFYVVKKNEPLNLLPMFKAFREIRQKKGYTLSMIEEFTGISASYLSQLELGKAKNPSFKVVAKLKEFYSL